MCACKADNPNRKCAVALVTSKELLSDGPKSCDSSSLFNPILVTVTAQPAASHTVHRVHRPSDMNRGYNLLAFPHGGYLIREKREGWTPERTMDPLRPSMRGEYWRTKILMEIKKDRSI